MALPTSSLSIMCAQVADFIRIGLDAAANNINVMIGPPSAAAQETTMHRVNLFFYRFEPSGFGPRLRPDEPWMIRLYCLVSAFGILDDDVSPGENELRMLGEVLRLFHENPILAPLDVNGEQVRLQSVFQPLGSDELNNIWSTQNETVYHPSAAYEIALGPVVPSEVFIGSPLVGALGSQTSARMDARHQAFSGQVQTPPVNAFTVDVDNPAWEPRICFVHQDACAQSLAFDVDSAEFASFNPQIWVAGDPAVSVDLQWEVWNSNGWSEMGAPLAVNPFSIGIDPDSIPSPIPGTFPAESPLPFSLAAEENAGQALLYARRSYSPRPDRPPIQLRSNPLLISLYRNGANP